MRRIADTEPAVLSTAPTARSPLRTAGAPGHRAAAGGRQRDEQVGDEVAERAGRVVLPGLKVDQGLAELGRMPDPVREALAEHLEVGEVALRVDGLVDGGELVDELGQAGGRFERALAEGRERPERAAEQAGLVGGGRSGLVECDGDHALGRRHVGPRVQHEALRAGPGVRAGVRQEDGRPRVGRGRRRA